MNISAFWCSFKFLGLLLFWLSAPVFAKFQVISIDSLENPIALHGTDELILPFSTDRESFIVILLEEQYISARLYLETDTGQVLLESKIRDLYLRRRLLVTDAMCHRCRIRITGWTEHPEKSKIQISFNRYTYEKNDIRFSAEQKMRNGAFLEEGSSENIKLSAFELYKNAVDKWNQVYKSTVTPQIFYLAENVRNESSDKKFMDECKNIYKEKKSANPFYFESCISDKPSAFDFYKSAAFDWKKIDDEKEIMNALFIAGNISDDASSDDSRQSYFEEAKNLALIKQDFFAYSRLYSELGRIEFETGNYEKAEGIYKSALEKINNVKTPKCIFSKGNIFHQLGQIWLLKENDNKAKKNAYYKAGVNFANAYKEFTSISDASSMADILNTQGYLNRRLNKFDLAASQHQVAYTLSKITSDSIWLEMRTLHYMSLLSANRGRYFYALHLADGAEKEAVRLNSLYSEVYIKENKAKIALDLGRYKESADVYLQIEHDAKTVGLDDDLKMIYTNVGLNYAMLGDYKLASSYFDKAQVEITKSPSLESENDLNRAKIASLLKQEKYEDALTLQNNLIYHQDNSNELISGRNLFQLAEINMHLGQWDNAFTNAHNAIKLHKRVNDDLFFTKSNYLAAVSLFKKMVILQIY